MGAEFYLVFDGDIGSDDGPDGKSVALVADQLNQLLADAGLPTLLDFFSSSPEEVFEFVEDDADLDVFNLASKAWFDAQEGLKVIRHLLAVVGTMRASITNIDDVQNDLRGYERQLITASELGARWHLAIDY
ncbi:MAG: hypothetical protein AAGB29_09150 [Planctomycetota bacterium]